MACRQEGRSFDVFVGVSDVAMAFQFVYECDYKNN